MGALNSEIWSQQKLLFRIEQAPEQPNLDTLNNKHTNYVHAKIYGKCNLFAAPMPGSCYTLSTTGSYGLLIITVAMSMPVDIMEFFPFSFQK